MKTLLRVTASKYERPFRDCYESRAIGLERSCAAASEERADAQLKEKASALRRWPGNNGL